MKHTALKISLGFILFLLYTNNIKSNPSPFKNVADAPVLITAKSSVDGNIIELSFDKNMADPTGKENEFSTNANSSITNISLKTGNPQIIVLEIDQRIRYGQTVEISYTQGTIKSEDDVPLESFASETVINNLVEPPSMVSAKTNIEGSLIELSFDKPMSDPTTKESQFSVNSSSSIGITDIGLKGGDQNTMIINLETNILAGATVTISYTEGDISSTDHGLLDAFNNEPVQNNAAESPTLQLAATNRKGDQIELSFDQNMADPSGSLAEFSVSNGTNLPISDIALKNGSTDIIILTLQQIPGWQDAITVSYVKGTLKSIDGGYLNSFSEFSVANNIVEPPSLESASSSVDGLTVELVFDKQMKDPLGEHSSFNIAHNGGNQVTKAELKQGSEFSIILSLQTAIPFGENVSLSYIMGEIQSSEGGYLHNISDFPVTNNVVTPPQLANAFTNSIGDTITLIFNKEMADPAQTTDQFEVNSNGIISISKISLGQTNPKTFFIELASKIDKDASILLSYTKGTIKSADGANLESISDHNVANNVETDTWFADYYLSKKVKLFPNPSNGNFSLEINDFFDNFQLQIVDTKGGIIKTENISKTPANKLLHINIKNHAKGIYYIKLSNKTHSICKKVLIK